MQQRIFEYDELKKWVNYFHSEAIDIMIVEGSPGAGKSSIIRQSLSNKKNNEYCWLQGRLSAICLYEKLYEYRDMPVFLDDIDGVYKDKECITMLKCLCSTEKEKTLGWGTKTISRGMLAPMEFKTKSKIVIITNSWKKLNTHIGAIQDRGILLLFHPPVEELHRYVGELRINNPSSFDDEVYSFIEKNLQIIAEPSIRHYRNATQMKAVGANWQNALTESFGLSDNAMCVLSLQQIKGISENERSKRFASIMKKSPRTYWRSKLDLIGRGVKFDDPCDQPEE